MTATRIYSGHCHCGAVRFRFRSDEITTACRCNCSMCIRKGAVMSSRYIPREDFEELIGVEGLSVYRFGDRVVNHYFCGTCGVYPLHDATVKPGQYRVNLGCIDDLDPLGLAVTLIDGRSF